MGINHCDVVDIGLVDALCRSLISSVQDRHDDQIEIWRWSRYLQNSKRYKLSPLLDSHRDDGPPFFYCYTTAEPHCRFSCPADAFG